MFREGIPYCHLLICAMLFMWYYELSWHSLRASFAQISMCFLSLKILHKTFPHLSQFLALAAFLASLSSSVYLHSLWCFLIDEILYFDPQLEQETCLFSPCMFLMCSLKYFVQVEQRLHKAFSVSFPLCLSTWYFRRYLLPNDFEQMLQRNSSDAFFSVVCPSMWFFRVRLFAKYL